MAIGTRPKRTGTAHRKRSGSHHRKSDSYLKTYWPYIPMLLIVGFGFVVNGIWSHSSVLGAQSDYSATALLDATNQQRSDDNETSLALNQDLSQAAQAKANDMVTKNYWAHTSPDGQTPWSFITAAGYSYEKAGENLAYGFNNADDVLSAWMNSPTHRANVLGADYKDVGFGVAQSQNYQGNGPETVVVAEYGEPAGAVPGTNNGVAGAADSNDLATAKPVSRIQLMTGGQAAWSTAVVSAIAGAAIMLFVVRHGLRLKRLLLEGEHFVARHAFLDIGLVFIGTLAIIFAQASGAIH